MRRTLEQLKIHQGLFPLVTALVLAGCAPTVPQAIVSITVQRPEPAGSNCESGGTRLESGLDRDGDGQLDATELSSISYVCNGAAGPAGLAGQSSLVVQTSEAPGPSCEQGGTKVEAGLDADADGQLDPDEVSSISWVCNGAAGTGGLSALVRQTPEPAGANCAQGGSRIEAGLDANGNGALDPEEVSRTSYSCNGAPGAQSLVRLTPEPAGQHCVAGGLRVESGLDLDADGQLEATEVQQTAWVCNGTNGAAMAGWARLGMMAGSPLAAPTPSDRRAATRWCLRRAALRRRHVRLTRVAPPS